MSTARREGKPLGLSMLLFKGASHLLPPGRWPHALLNVDLQLPKPQKCYLTRRRVKKSLVHLRRSLEALLQAAPSLHWASRHFVTSGDQNFEHLAGPVPCVIGEQVAGEGNMVCGKCFRDHRECVNSCHRPLHKMPGVQFNHFHG